MGYLIGAFLALYFLIGRWNFLRLEETFETVSAAADPRVWLISMASAAVLFVSCFNNRGWWQRFRLQRVDAAVILFLGYMLLTTFWAPNKELAFDKAYEVSLLLAVALLLAVVRQRDAAANVAHGFFFTLLAVGGAMACLAILQSTGGRVSAPGGGPNTFGRNMGLTALSAIYFASRSRASVPTKVAAGAMVIVALLLVLTCGSRGGLLSACMGAMTIIVLSRTSLTRKTLSLGGIAAMGTVALFFTPAGRNALEVFEHRIVEQTLENRYMSSRDDLWGHAIELAQLQPTFGLGLNGYRANSWTYPHNLILEVWVEGGYIGLALLFLAGSLFVHGAWRHRHTISSPAIAALVLAAAAAQTSGDLFDSRGVFLLMALISPVAVRTTARAWQATRSRSTATPKPSLA